MNKLFIFIFFSIFSGCATFQTLPKSLVQDNPVIYSGIITVWFEPSKTEGLLFHYDEMAGLVTLVVYSLDSPFSFIADTLLLPITIPLAVGKRLVYAKLDNDPRLESSWSKQRGKSYYTEAKKICENLGMRLPTSNELELATSSGLLKKWNVCHYCNNVYIVENKNAIEKQESFGSIRCLRKGKFH